MAKKKTARRVPVDPVLIFINARGFYHAAGVIDREGEIPALLWPKIACSVFALELYLKCLHRIRRRYIEGHDVGRLFGSLSRVDRSRVTELYDASIQGHPNYQGFVDRGLLLDIDSVLTRASDMFIRGRYWHEHALPRPDRNGITSNVGIDRLSGSIGLYVIELRPDFPGRANRFQFPFTAIPQQVK